MPNYTNNYNLTKPKKSENYDIEDVTSKNMDIIDTELFNKVEKVAGKGLSTNDFTDGYKVKIDNLKNYDDTSIKNQLDTLKQKEKEDISNINQEQETQNSNITLNTTEIDKLKTENEMLKSQIPTRQSNRSRGKSRR